MSNIPQDLKFSKEHEWVRVDSNRAYVGITDFAQDELGDIVFVELPEVGHKISVNETFGTVESVKTVSDLFAPLSGSILEVNDKLGDSPELVNQDPYGEGWMVVIEIANSDDIESLLDADAYTRHTAD